MNWPLLLLLLAGMVCTHQANTRSSATQATDRNLFAADIYQAIATEQPNENVVISPAAIQTALALTAYGAKGKTAQELNQGARLTNSAGGDGEQLVRPWGEYQLTFSRNPNIRIFLQYYISESLEFKHQFRTVAQRDFEGNIEKADFHPPYNRRTAERINKAVEEKTGTKIGAVVRPEQLNDRTDGIMVNAISYEGAHWQKAFKPDKTAKRGFITGNGQTVTVETMWTQNEFRYGEISQLDAKVIELPYQNSELAMLVLLPNSNHGLQSLERSLAGKDLLALIEPGLSKQKVEVYLPKFSVSYGLELNEPLKKLGVSTVFTRDGDMGQMYRMFVNHYLNSANHRAHLEVTEAGTEQPQEGGGGIFGYFSRNKKFEADHPFMFVVRQGDSIIFMGHIANYAYV